MSRLFRFPDSVKRSPSVKAWPQWERGELGRIARHWFGIMRACGDDVREVLHDGHPTACVADAAFAYVDAFTSHVNLGFFCGAALPDPKGLLEGSGKRMRHIKIKPGAELDAVALTNLINLAYADMKQRLQQANDARS